MKFFQKNLQGKKDIWYFLNEESPPINNQYLFIFFSEFWIINKFIKHLKAQTPIIQTLPSNLFPLTDFFTQNWPSIKQFLDFLS